MSPEATSSKPVAVENSLFERDVEASAEYNHEEVLDKN